MSTKKDKFSKKDITYMELALNLARARQGHTGINPSVGCVIVKNDEIISIGQTNYNGRPHAEVNALSKKRNDYKDSEMYITLEPCSHYGKTPPCTEKIINKKIKHALKFIHPQNIIVSLRYHLLAFKKYIICGSVKNICSCPVIITSYGTTKSLQ